MSSLKFNMVAASVLTAGVIASTSGFLSEMIYHHEFPETNAYQIEVAEATAAVAASDEPEMSVLDLLADADLAKGEKALKKCTSCHTFEEGGANKVGPNLYNIVNGSIAGSSGFGYSDALSGMSGQTWSYENLDAFMASPKGFAPGTKMSFGGFKKVSDRANLIAYLRTLSGSPAPLPE